MARKAPHNVTMRDIARKAGVSAITVSRALGDGTVNTETREKVLQTAHMMGYQFNHSARNLRLKKTSTVAVVIEMKPSSERPIAEPYPMSLLGGIIQELSAADYSVTLLTAEKFMRRRPAVDATILLGQGLENDSVKLVDKGSLPLVVWGSSQNAGTKNVVVGSDNVAGGKLAAQHFLDRGKRSALFLGNTGHAEAADRLRGFNKAFAGRDGNLLDVLTCDFTFNDGCRAMEDAIARHGSAFDAIFAASDAIAMGAIRVLIENGRRIGEDISVIGFDDATGAQLFTPPLTTIRQDWIEGGRQLARTALALTRGETIGGSVLPVKLIVRAT